MILRQLGHDWPRTARENCLMAAASLRQWKFAPAIGVLLVATTQVPASARVVSAKALGGERSAPVLGVLQCVPYARRTSGIRLFGDAHTWWSQARGKYMRGRLPQPGAVMAMQPHGGSTLGHVATVSRIVNSRTILISHANWSAPGKIERDVMAVDVSSANDWSEVRVWFAPIQNLGGAHWPVFGFIYRDKSSRMQRPADTAMTTLAELKHPEHSRQHVYAAYIDARQDPIGAIITGTY
jgi:hypothetical protein